MRTFSTAFKINMAVERPPTYRAFKPGATDVEYPSYVHIGPTMEYLEKAYDDAKYGRPSTRPFFTPCVPTIRITSYNVCYTKLLRRRSPKKPSKNSVRCSSPASIRSIPSMRGEPEMVRTTSTRRASRRSMRTPRRESPCWRSRITSYNVCYTKLLRAGDGFTRSQLHQARTAGVAIAATISARSRPESGAGGAVR